MWMRMSVGLLLLALHLCGTVAHKTTQYNVSFLLRRLPIEYKNLGKRGVISGRGFYALCANVDIDFFQCGHPCVSDGPRSFLEDPWTPGGDVIPWWESFMIALSRQQSFWVLNSPGFSLAHRPQVCNFPALLTSSRMNSTSFHLLISYALRSLGPLLWLETWVAWFISR